MNPIFKQICLLFAVFSFLSGTSFAGEISFKPEKSQKIESTFSGDINQESSIHLITFKDKSLKKFGLKPFFIDKDDSIIEFEYVLFEFSAPSVISFHRNDNTLTLVLLKKFYKPYQKSRTKPLKELVIIDFDLVTKKSTQKIIEGFDDSSTIIRLPNKTIILHKHDAKLEISQLKNSQNIEELKIEAKKEELELFNSIFSDNVQYVNTNEYVKNGSVAATKLYFDDNLLFFDTVDKKNQIVDMMTIDLMDLGKLKFTTFGNLSDHKIKNINTFIYDKKIFIVLKDKNGMSLEVFDIVTGEKQYHASLQEDLKDFIGSENLNKLSQKVSWSQNRATITVNKSIEDKMVVRFDFINVNTYNYHHDWWFHHWMWQNQMMQQQQLMNQNINNMPRFGPNPDFYEDLAFLDLKKEDISIDLVFDENFTPLKDAKTETKRKEVDKDFYLKIIEKNRDSKHASVAFSSRSIRSIFYSKTQKTFFIKTNTLKL
ncbi:hypothetical protein [Aquimarina mytili]|uniref:Uncharacterized protein n=1 Tax=Aquimarina mytili TaxID=874423 RepID=A0A936ZTG4_9FLAO|nr:hypothetical protein [Aquimarina mytili]MBL0685112.1 hypothetical protein [Aquimarina mytili]